MDDTLVKSIASRALQIKGWFEEEELGLLINCVMDLTGGEKYTPNNPLNIIEVGSFYGRSTIALGLAVIELNLPAVIYAIDPHKGIRSGRHDRIYRGEKTYHTFIKNIKEHGLEKVIKCIKSKSTEVEITVPISLILIDGLHLYENVKEDFLHFERNLLGGSLIAFHDYHNDFPGVRKFVNSLMNPPGLSTYVKAAQSHTLIVLKRTCSNAI